MNKQTKIIMQIRFKHPDSPGFTWVNPGFTLSHSQVNPGESGWVQGSRCMHVQVIQYIGAGDDDVETYWVLLG